MPPRRRTAGRGRAPKRRVEWTGSVPIDAVGLAANSKVGIDLNQQPFIENLGSPTLVRTRSLFDINVGSTGTENDDVLMAVGIAVVNSNAAGTSASLPGPITDVGFPWLFHASKGFRFFELASAANDGTQWTSAAHWTLEVDSKAMRKLSSEEELVLVMETIQAAGTASIQLLPHLIRFLYMQ